MSIEKKSLINTLKTAKKANIVKEEVTVSGVTATPATMAKRLSTAAKKAGKTYGLSPRKGLRPIF